MGGGQAKAILARSSCPVATRGAPNQLWGIRRQLSRQPDPSASSGKETTTISTMTAQCKDLKRPVIQLLSVLINILKQESRLYFFGK